MINNTGTLIIITCIDIHKQTNRFKDVADTTAESDFGQMEVELKKLI